MLEGDTRGHAGRQGSKDASDGATKWRLVILQLHKRGPSDVPAYTHIKSWELKAEEKRENRVLQLENSSSPQSDLITTSNPSSSSSDLGRRPAGRQQPR